MQVRRRSKVKGAKDDRNTAYYCANAKEKGPSVCTGFRGLRESVALPLVLSGLRDDLMQPKAYESFRNRVLLQLMSSRGAAEDALRLHDARVADLDMRHRNLIRAIETGDDPTLLVGRLNAVDAELKEMRGKRDDIVPPEIELPEGLPELYRQMVRDRRDAAAGGGRGPAGRRVARDGRPDRGALGRRRPWPLDGDRRQSAGDATQNGPGRDRRRESLCDFRGSWLRG
jgi:hypothetical protein